MCGLCAVTPACRERNVFSQKQQNFGGGGGTGVSIPPVGFLAIDKHGSVEMINVNQTTAGGTIDQIGDLLDRSPEIIEKLKAVFKKKDK